MQTLARMRVSLLRLDWRVGLGRFPLVVLLLLLGYSGRGLADECTFSNAPFGSFDCESYGSPAQRRDINARYGAAAQALSQKGRAELQEDQGRWSRYMAAACGLTGDERPPEADRCLDRQLNRRGEVSLSFTGQHGLSPYVFTIRGTYLTTPDVAGSLPFQTELSYPQIDHLSDPPETVMSDAVAWNALIAERMGGQGTASLCAGGKGDVYRRASVNLASTLLIGVTVEQEDNCRGTAWRSATGALHYRSSDAQRDQFLRETHYNIVVMTGDVHELSPVDLFPPGDRWKRFLIERLGQEVKKQARDHRLEWHPSLEAMTRVVVSPSNWTFSTGELRIRVNGDALPSPDPVGGFAVEVSRTDLQSLLSFKGKRILNAME